MFSISHQIKENPDFSEWDWFAKAEYERLALEEENSDVVDVMDGADESDENET